MKPQLSYTIWFSQRTGSPCYAKLLKPQALQERLANGSIARLTYWKLSLSQTTPLFKNIFGSLAAHPMVSAV